MIKKLLYVANMAVPGFAEAKGLLTALGKLGLEEALFLLSGEAVDLDNRVADHGVKCKIFVKKSVSVSEILDTAHQEAVSIIAAQLKKRPSGLLSPSFVKNLIRSSPLPVVIIPETAPSAQSQEGGIFEHAIFPTDWSPVSEKSLIYILSLKELIKELELVTVISKRLSVRDLRNLNKRLEGTRQRLLDEGIDAEAHIYAGKPAEEIMLAARDYGATSIVMGTTRRWPLMDIFSRSCSYEVAERAAVPTLVIPYPEGN